LKEFAPHALRDYAFIADGERGALIGPHGDLAWMCAPRWDSGYAGAAYYSHPWAWSEIGFGGPAYPRGYSAPGVGKRERWEVADSRNRDPVRWGAWVDRARAEHERLLHAGSDDE
jgi:hypothetical protein